MREQLLRPVRKRAAERFIEHEDPGALHVIV
jgi:hypothetical protein